TLGLAIAIALGYWLVIVVVRWNRIAQPTQGMLAAQVRSLRSEIDLLGGSPQITKVCELLDSAAALIDESKLPWTTHVANVIFWSRGKELVGWEYVHEAQVQLAAYLAPE